MQINVKIQNKENKNINQSTQSKTVIKKQFDSAEAINQNGDEKKYNLKNILSCKCYSKEQNNGGWNM